MRPTAYADKTLRKSQDGVLYWRWFDEKTVHLSLQLRVSRYLKGDLLKESDDEYRHLSRRFYWSGYFVRMMNCTTYHTSSTRNVSIPRPRTFCHGRLCAALVIQVECLLTKIEILSLGISVGYAA